VPHLVPCADRRYIRVEIGLVAGEMKDPVRDLPRVINSAMSIVITGFVLMNAALYIVLPIEKLRETDTVATVSLSSPPLGV
jgi:amino acid permease